MKNISIESFNNTELAFASKTDWQLKKAYYLFRIVNNNTMARIATFCANLGLNLHLPIKGILKNTVFEHFCGGETISECKLASDKMAEYNVGSILDYSVEGKDSEEAFDNALSETLQTIDNAQDNPDVPYCVFKPTGLGSSGLMEKVHLGESLSDSEKDAFERIRNRYDTLSKAAYDNDVRLLIDAEDSWYQNTIDDLLYELMEKYNKKRAIVFNTYQMYRWESLENIKKAHQAANEKGFVLGAKLVRGAYMEVERERAEEKGYPDPICVDKEATDKSYDNGLKYCVENINNIELFNGTHNEQSNFYLADLMSRMGLERNTREFSLCNYLA